MSHTWTSNLHKQISLQLTGIVQTDIHAQIPTHQQISLNKQQLNLFKTKFCQSIQNKDDQEFHTIHHSVQFPYFYSCSYYHSENDHRRAPQLPDGYMYEDKYIAEGFGQAYCLNWIEYMYHPMVYKTKECDNLHCMRKYCPKLHKGEQCTVAGAVKNETIEILDNKIRSIEMISQLRSMKNVSDSQNESLKSEIEQISSTINKYVTKLKKFDLEEASKVINIQNQIRTLATDTSSLPNKPKEKAKENVPKQQQYDVLFFMEQLNIIEDRHHQFKMFKDKDPRRITAMVLEYISAFLNSDGGTMYLGINDESIVHGLDVTQSWIDQFQLYLDSDGRDHLNPPLIPQKYGIRIIPVSHHKKHGLKVIQIKVFPQSEQEKKILTLYKKQCYLRMNASNHRLSASDIMEYMRLVYNKGSQDLEMSDEKLQKLGHSDLKQLQQKVSKISGRISNTLKKRVKESEDKNEQEN